MASGTLHTGQTILVSGLIVQIVFLILFLTIELTFYYRVVKYPDEHIMIIRNVPSQYNNWNSILIALLICSTLFLFRCIFRLIEGVQGTHGYLFSHEIFLYCFDTALMFINIIVFSSQNTGKYHLMFKSYFSTNQQCEELTRTIIDNYLFY